MLKKCIEAITRNIDLMERENKEYYQGLMTKIATQEIRDYELDKIIDLIKDVDYAEP